MGERGINLNEYPFIDSKVPSCLSSIILSPLNGYVKMSPYETGDICIESERIATSGGDFIVCDVSSVSGTIETPHHKLMRAYL